MLGASIFQVGGPNITPNRPTRRNFGTITVTPLVPLAEPVRLTELTMRIETASPRAVIEAIQVVADRPGFPEVGRVEGDAIGPEVRIPLAGEGLLVADGAPVRLTVYFSNRGDAHHSDDTLVLAWDAVAARFANDAPAPVVNQLSLAKVYNLVNNPPTAQPDVFAVAEGASALLDVADNDADPDADPLTIELVDLPLVGVAEVVDGQVRYTHDGSEAPPADRFTYRVLDPRGAASEIVDVDLVIEPVNDVPVGAPETYFTREDVPLVMEADLGVLVNDFDAEGDLLSAVLEAPPAVGDLQLDPDGRFVYVPAPDMNGDVTFTYRPDDGEAQGEPVTVTITVVPDDDPPRPAEGPFATPQGTPVVLQLAGADPEGGDVVLLIEAFPDRGQLVALRPTQGQVTYVPPAGFVGQDRFAYRLTDRSTLSEVFEAVVDVRP